MPAGVVQNICAPGPAVCFQIVFALHLISLYLEVEALCCAGVPWNSNFLRRSATLHTAFREPNCGVPQSMILK